METHILELLYSILMEKGELELAKKVWKLRSSSKPTIIMELSVLERKASVVGTRFLATAKLALLGSKERLDDLSTMAQHLSGYPLPDK